MRTWRSSSPELRRARAALTAQPGIVATALGHPAGSRGDGPMALLAYVDPGLARPRLPARLGGLVLVRQDVRSVSEHSALADAGDARYTRRVRPIRPGFSFGLSRRVGTLGAIVRSASGERLLLASSHVLNVRPDGRPYALYQPSGRDRSGQDRAVASALRHTRLHPRAANRTEGGLARPHEDVDLGTHPLGPIRGTAPPALGQIVRKVSRTTGATTGRVTALDWCGRVRFGRREYLFTGQLVVTGDDEPVSLSGDSGALWVTPDGDAVAMNFAGSQEGRESICTPIDRTLARLGVILETGGPAGAEAP